MNEITKYAPQLPVGIQRQLNRQSHHMNYITKLAMEALGEQSQIYSFTVFQAFQTLNTIITLKKAFEQTGMPPETEALFQKLTQEYLAAMARIPQRSCEMIHQVLERASVPPDDGGLLGALIEGFMGRANE
jgi:hypothetical protein